MFLFKNNNFLRFFSENVTEKGWHDNNDDDDDPLHLRKIVSGRIFPTLAQS